MIPNWEAMTGQAGYHLVPVLVAGRYRAIAFQADEPGYPAPEARALGRHDLIADRDLELREVEGGKDHDRRTAGVGPSASVQRATRRCGHEERRCQGDSSERGSGAEPSAVLLHPSSRANVKGHTTPGQVA